MRIRALELEQFRKFEQKTRVAGFADGLNVLCGPNEFGKSTLLAAIRGLLFERHASKAEAIRRMQPWRGDAAPRLTMEFDLGGHVWQITKQFVHRPSARLSGPDGTFDGDAAEEELQRLLGFGGAGRRGATAEQLGVWGALWVRQRESVMQADDAARGSVQGCLDAEVGVLTGGEKGRAILLAAKKQLAELQTATGRPRGRYAEVTEALAQAENRLKDLDNRSERLSDDTVELRDAMQKHRALTDPETEARDQEALEGARRRKLAAELFEQRRAAAEARVNEARHARDAAVAEHQVRLARSEQIREARKALAGHQPAAEAARGELAEAEKRLRSCREVEEAARQAVRETQLLARRRRELVELVRRAEPLERIRQTVGQAEDLQANAVRLRARLEQLPVDGESITAIRSAQLDAETARSALLAQAAIVDFELDASARGKVMLDGEPIMRDRQSTSVLTLAEIAIAGIGRILIRPTIPDLHAQRARADKSQAHMAELLAQVGCRNADEAERGFTERGDTEVRLREAEAAVKRLTPGDRKAGLPPGLDALRTDLVQRQQRIEAGKEALGLTALPDAADAEATCRAAETEEQEAQDRLTAAREAIDAASKEESRAREALHQAEGNERQAREVLERLAREDAAAALGESDEALAARLEDTQNTHAERAGTLAALESERTGDTVEAMDIRIQRYEQALRNRNESAQRLKERMAELRTSIGREGGAGVSELIEQARREIEVAVRERDTLRWEAEALQLLIEILTNAEKEAKERFLAPVTERVTPYLRSLFPSAEIVCDETLRITGLLRDGPALQDFDRLSDGTQEQLAVLTRLAFAQLLAEQGKPAMIILDDALAYSDGERIERMFDILAQAARHTQILVMTCREDLFRRLGAHELTLSRV